MKIRRKSINMLTGALLGYIWGWIWGWSLFDPNSDVWALAAGFGALIGLLVGLFPVDRRQKLTLLCMTFGLYIGWIARTLLFGDRLSGWGLLTIAVCVIAGGVVGLRLDRGKQSRILPVLAGALYIGFFGGFVIDVILMDKVLGLVRTHSILSQAPAVLACGLAGGAILARLRSAKSSESTEIHTGV